VTISADTQVTDLSTDDHACLTFGDRTELLDLTAAFVRDGLAGGLRVVVVRGSPKGGLGGWVPPGAEGSPRGASPREGALLVASCQDSLMGPGGFSAGHAIGWLRGQLAAARREGYPGIRVAMDMGWALQPMAGIQELPALEERIADAVRGAGMSVLCGYDRERFDPVTLASVAPFHSHSVAAATYHGDPVLRICRQYVPPGIRLAGEMDFLAGEALALALSEAIRIGGDITINMTDLSFIDGFSIRMIMDAAGSLAPARTVVLQCRPGLAARFVQFGVTDLPQVHLVTVDDG
jgi:anti-anti-sigma regulatory factor